MGIVIDIVIVAISLGAIAVGVIRSAFRGVFVTLIHCAGAAVAAILSGIGTAFMVPPINSALSDLIFNNLNGEAAKTVYRNASLTELLKQAPGALITPLVFVAVFFILKIIFDVVIFFATKGEKGRLITFPGHRAVAAVIGLILTAGCLWIFFMPVTGTVRSTGQVMNLVYENKDTLLSEYKMDGVTETAFEFAKSMSDSKLVKFYDGILGSGKVFDSMTSVTIKGKRMSLSAEIGALTDMADTVLSVVPSKESETGDVKNPTMEDISTALRDIAEQLDDAEIASSIVTDELDQAVDAWKKGGSYFGVTLLTGNKKTDDLFEGLLECVEGGDEEQLKDLLVFAADVADVLPPSLSIDTVSQNGGQEGSSAEEKLENNKQVVEELDMKAAVELVDKAFENDTMNPFAERLIKWILTLAADAVGVDASKEINAITLADKTKAEVRELVDMLKGMVDEAMSFQSKFVNDIPLTEEEKQILTDALDKLTENKIIGAAVTVIRDGAKDYKLISE